MILLINVINIFNIIDKKNWSNESQTSNSIFTTRWLSHQKQPPEVFHKRGVLKNFVKLTRSTCTSFLINLLAWKYFWKSVNLTKPIFRIYFVSYFVVPNKVSIVLYLYDYVRLSSPPVYLNIYLNMIKLIRKIFNTGKILI